MKTKPDKRWFQAKLRDKKLSQRGLAKLMHLDPSAITLIFDGAREVRAAEAARLSQFLGVSLPEIVSHLGTSVEAFNTLRFGEVPIHGVLDMFGNITEASGKGYAPTPAEAPEDTRALQVRDSGSSFDGWFVYYVPRDDVSLEVLGKLCVVETVEGERLLRHVRGGYSGGYTLANRIGPEMETETHLTKASPVTWMKAR